MPGKRRSAARCRQPALVLEPASAMERVCAINSSRRVRSEERRDALRKRERRATIRARPLSPLALHADKPCRRVAQRGSASALSAGGADLSTTPRGLLVLGGERARQLAQRLLMALIRDLGEVARQFQAHSLALADRLAALAVEAVEEIADGNAEHPGNFV
jgi:hypothetical protein